MRLGDDAAQRVIPLPGPDEQRQPPSPPVCPQCRLVGEHHPTCYGAHVLLEPGLTAPAHMVPAWHRWYVDSDGTAWSSAVCSVPK
ncbi:DUF6083 domain-containing protein [Streptomyces sp. NPDC001537]